MSEPSDTAGPQAGVAAYSRHWWSPLLVPLTVPLGLWPPSLPKSPSPAASPPVTPPSLPASTEPEDAVRQPQQKEVPLNDIKFSFHSEAVYATPRPSPARSMSPTSSPSMCSTRASLSPSSGESREVVYATPRPANPPPPPPESDTQKSEPQSEPSPESPEREAGTQSPTPSPPPSSHSWTPSRSASPSPARETSPPVASTSPVPPPVPPPDWDTTSGSSANEAPVEAGVDLDEYVTLRAARAPSPLLPPQRPPTQRAKLKAAKAWTAVRGWWADTIIRRRNGDVPSEEDDEEVVGLPEEDDDQVDAASVFTAATSTIRRRQRGRRRRYIGQHGFEDLRRYVKQGGDFCKDLGAILNERSEAELQYAKALTKLSAKLLKAVPQGPPNSGGSRNSDVSNGACAAGTVAAAWHSAAKDMDAAAELHRTFAHALADDVVKPLRALHEKQHRIRKSVEAGVDKTGRALSDWRQAEAKAKKSAFAAARDQERVWASVPSPPPGQAANGNATTEANAAGAAKRRRKVEDAAKRADVEYYSFCLRAERARLDWEAAVARGARCLQILDEERLQELANLASRYVRHLRDLGPALAISSDRLAAPVAAADPAGDAAATAAAAASQAAAAPAPEQLLPDFYAEHVTLAMNRERRRQALLKVLQLLKQDLDRERRSKQGVEILARALLSGTAMTPTVVTNEDDARRNAIDKLHHMRSMLTYLEAARYKVQGALAELEGRPRANHPLAEHILVQRDRHGLQRSVLRVPPWARDDAFTAEWADRGAADGTSAQPDSDADEFSSQDSDGGYGADPGLDDTRRKEAAGAVFSSASPEVSSEGTHRNVITGTCRALYHYDANLYDELNLNPGDVIHIHNKQADGWWLGELNGTVGIFPATYVEEISDVACK